MSKLRDLVAGNPGKNDEAAIKTVLYNYTVHDYANLALMAMDTLDKKSVEQKFGSDVALPPSSTIVYEVTTDGKVKAFLK